MALKITRGVVFKAQKVVVYGPEGIGKSTFAAEFPDPLFIDTEGSTNLMDIARLPRPTSWTMLLEMIKEVINTPGCCKTLVIDTIDWAEQLCVNHICAVHNKKGVEDFGYGNGYVYVKEEFGRMLNLLSDVIDRQINVVLTAHAQIRKFEQPDECGSYDRYELKLGKKTSSQTSPLVKEWADMVLFANYKVHVVEIEKKKKSSGGARVMYTTHHPSWDAKNRHDLKAELPFEYAQIAYCIPNNSDEAKQETSNDQFMLTKQSPMEPIPPIESFDKTGTKCSVCREPQFNTPSGPCCKNGHGGADPLPPEQQQAHPPDNDPPKQNQTAVSSLKGLPKPLTDLMTANNVTVEEIQKVVSEKGYYPKDTPLNNYDPGFIEGVLVGAWDQVFKMIQFERNIPFK